ncbi:alpha,alpha-trehalase TreF [Sphingobium algorifonticola]|uniref:Alpha,alpha-trehalase TreF n=1 Tax=Sphingobium algorifonticola TaxID=2008318 RepID=A0A437JDP8_9SPHN|nr:alpha,alpha-trehalase TreF [Sphingobium algorifonticola]
MLRRAIMACVALCLAGATAPPDSPAERYGPLFEAVQSARLFDDSKTFADAIPRESPDAIVAAYRADPPRDVAQLRAFVARHFILPDEARPPRADTLAEHIRSLWPQLTRPPHSVTPAGSEIALPAPYVVPGGRFREIYYWDSYFTMLGLKADGRADLVESMLDDFESLIARYGRIPNGTRTYYLSRSQPPFYALMVALSDSDSPRLMARRLKGLRAEHDFWMAGAACLDTSGRCARVVRMPDGSLLNRYWDDKATPRDESWAEDVETARKSGRPLPETYRDLRAGAESGWDFSSRWLADGTNLTTIRTSAIVPVDLNSLLWILERSIAARCRAAGDETCATRYEGLAARRRAAIGRYLWNATDGWFGDWDHAAQRLTPILSAATLYPLFAGIATPDQANRIASVVRADLLGPGGLRTTRTDSGQQWDAPNGWAPLQWIAVAGLRRYRHNALAADIATRWIATVDRNWKATGKILEKYDVEQQRPGGGGEYPLQDGFGWTNGVTRALMACYPPSNDSEQRPAAPADCSLSYH